MDGVKAAKRRKITDKSVPNALAQLPEFAEDSQMYQSLLEMEKKLDWTMNRKKVEVQDALARNPTTARTLRLFLSHTVSGQTWQNGEAGAEGVNFETGQGIPAWSLKVEGRLLELPNQRARDRVPPRKFSTLIKRMIVELDRDPILYPDGNVVEWPRGPAIQQPLDGFTIRRTGDQPTKVRLIIYLEQTPEQYKVAPDLGNVLGIKEESRVGIIQAMWNYIKIHGLQDKTDRRRIRADDYLRPIFGGEGIMFHQLPELVNRYLMPPDPVVIHYSFNPAQVPPERPSAWDIEVKMEDTSLKNRIMVTVQSSKDSMSDLTKLDDEIALLSQSLHNSHTKRQFLQSFANDPANFIQTWLASQSRDLESVLGSGPSEGATIRAEELRRSDFFRLPWVEEAVAWAGEKISSRDKTIVAEEFKDIEQDIELRKEGILKLQAAAEDYQHVLSKKKESTVAQETEKLMPLDALGIVMISHGEEFGDDSAFGTSLVKLGRAHCKAATLQEAFALTFQDTFITSCQNFVQDIKDYEHQRKKLESRRLSYDAAITKLEKVKGSKKEKEKERREAEDELQRSRLRYEETSEDVRSRMQAIQDNEIQQLRELTLFLDLKLNFVKQYYEVLQDVKANWCDESTMAKLETRRKSFHHVSSRATEDDKLRYVRPKGSTISNASGAVASSDISDEHRSPPMPTRRKSDAGNKTISRPSSRTSRKRSDSNATRKRADSDVTSGAPETPKGDKSGKKMNVTGWASSAMSSMTGRGKKDRDNFATLTNGDDPETPIVDSPRPPSSRSFSRKSPSSKAKELLNGSPKMSTQIMKPPSQYSRKLVRALHDFTGSSDELTFKAGDEITVIHEVLDDWWLGVLSNGRKGLFPTTYTETISLSSSSYQSSAQSSEDNLHHAAASEDSEDDIGYLLGGRIMDTSHPSSARFDHGFDAESMTSTVPEDEEESRLVTAKIIDEEVFYNPRYASPQLLPPSISSSRPTSEKSFAIKRPPPPLPSRRPTNTAAPPLPSRNSTKSQSNSPRPPASTYLTPSPSASSVQGPNISPFDSLLDVSST
ncbi:BAR-domain-containing protein [Suillus clintonianus]|uniref:BAR-domain-containing protein n=1 Tax=Suillus clintonianus TaxID=1904413 RepID=UPI001B873E43|nr:BAR-domain-containing protein [Suillus clintonianus]KAG2137476.1 BAR-domain-containing protein [Suillus clintonianus]